MTFVELYCKLNFARKQQFYHENLSAPCINGPCHPDYKEYESARESNRLNAGEYKAYADKLKSELTAIIESEMADL